MSFNKRNKKSKLEKYTLSHFISRPHKTRKISIDTESKMKINPRHNMTRTHIIFIVILFSLYHMVKEYEFYMLLGNLFIIKN